MSLIIPTFEQREAAKKERATIFEAVMQIQDAKSLHNLAVLAKTMEANEIEKKPLSLDEFVAYLDFPMIVRLFDLFKDESSEYTANAQIKELLSGTIDSYMGSSEEKAESA